DGGALLAAGDKAGVLLFDLKDQERPPQVLPHKSVEYVALSRDGRWAATGIRSYSSRDQVMVKVWDLQQPAGSLLSHEFPFGQEDEGIGSNALLLFSPDHRYLLTGTKDEYRAWKVGSWQLDRSLTLRREDGYHAAAAMAFSADGASLAVVPRPGEI